MNLRFVLTKSVSGASQRQRATVIGLGLRKLGSSRVLVDTPEVRGMLRKVLHLVTAVEERPTSEAAVAKARKPAAKPAKVAAKKRAAKAKEG